MHLKAVGGVFFRSRDPDALGAWYNKHFGITPGGPTFLEGGPTVLGFFPKDTDYFGGDQHFMINLRVDDLDATLAALGEAGIAEVKPRESMDGIGHFGWVNDPEGNRIELWEAAAPPDA